MVIVSKQASTKILKDSSVSYHKGFTKVRRRLHGIAGPLLVLRVKLYHDLWPIEYGTPENAWVNQSPCFKYIITI